MKKKKSYSFQENVKMKMKELEGQLSIREEERKSMELVIEFTLKMETLKRELRMAKWDSKETIRKREKLIKQLKGKVTIELKEQKKWLS